MKYGWIIILISAILGLLLALLLTISPTTVLFEPEFRAGDVPGVLRAWGITWLFFNVLALIVLFRGFRQGERWAWWTMWLLPLLWLSHFVFNPVDCPQPRDSDHHGGRTDLVLPHLLLRLGRAAVAR